MNAPQVFLAQYNQVVDAEVARSFLASHGIETFKRNEHIVSINQLYSNAVGGVKLYVLESDFETAQKLLTEVQLGHFALNHNELIGDPCPSCGSTNTERLPATDKGWAYMLLYFTGIPFLFLNHESYICHQCQSKWQVKQSLAWYNYLIPVLVALGILYLIQTILN